MKRFGILALTHHHAEAEALSAFSRPAGPWLDQLRLQAGWEELVYLNTCNRVEFLYVAAPGRSGADFLPAIRAFFPGPPPEAGIPLDAWEEARGEAAVRRLLEVVSGLDSLVFGDAQITGQFRRALATAQEFHTSGRWLRMLGEQALRTAQQLRQEVDFGERPTSIAEVSIRILREQMCGRAQVRLVLVGAGRMIRKAAARLKGWRRADLLFVNRTADRARALAATHGGEAMSLEEFCQHPPEFDALIAATATTAPILTPETLRHLPARRDRRLLLDMGIPANIAPETGRAEGFRRFDVLEIGRRANGVAQEVAELRAQTLPTLERGLRRIRDRILHLELSPAAARIRQEMQTRARTELHRWLSGPLAHLTTEDREALEGLADRIAAQTAQIPLADLQQLVQGCSCGGALQAVRLPVRRRPA